MIIIGKPTVYTEKEKAFLTADVHIPTEAALRYREITKSLKNCPWRTEEDYPPKAWENGGSKLYFEVEKKYADCLCTERSDAFVIALFWYAMVTGEDIGFETPMSERLYCGLTQRLIPTLCTEPYRPIKLTGSVSSEKLECRGAAGTGMTCGVDSFYTIRTHKLTHLAYYECGHIFHLKGVMDSKVSAEEYYKKAYEIADEKAASAADVAKQSGLEFIYVKSNLDEDLYRGGIIYRSMYGNLSCTLAVQKLFGTYISSSSGHGGDLKTGLIVPTQNYENLLCESCKTETLDYVSSDDAKRLEKLVKLADDALAAQHLDVCFNFGEKNCGECYGCLKTMIALDLLGKLNNFDKAFDLEKYYADRRKYIKILADGALCPELASVKETWADIVKYAKAHSGELCAIISELDGRV